MEEDLILRRKAELILGGDVSVSEGMTIPVRVSRSTAGPGAGSNSITLSFHGIRVKKTIVTGEADFELRQIADGYEIYRDGKLFIDGVSITPVGFHAPEQAFFNIDQRCVFHCVYCNSPLLGKESVKSLTPEKVVEMIRDSSQRESIKGIAFTSGIVGSVQATVELMASFVLAVSKEFPGIPVGVEPYITAFEQIDMLKAAGATEIKINIEAARKDIFDKVCPDLDYSDVKRMLSHAVDVFGRGKVASNMIYGFGESDEDVTALVEEMASSGIMVNLRPLKIGAINRENIESVLGHIESNTPMRAIALGKAQKKILSDHGLSPSDMKTMCFACGCCDLIPCSDL